jgi:hypothetical protein
MRSSGRLSDGTDASSRMDEGSTTVNSSDPTVTMSPVFTDRWATTPLIGARTIASSSSRSDDTSRDARRQAALRQTTRYSAPDPLREPPGRRPSPAAACASSRARPPSSVAPPTAPPTVPTPRILERPRFDATEHRALAHRLAFVDADLEHRTAQLCTQHCFALRTKIARDDRTGDDRVLSWR